MYFADLDFSPLLARYRLAYRLAYRLTYWPARYRLAYWPDGPLLARPMARYHLNYWTIPACWSASSDIR